MKRNLLMTIILPFFTWHSTGKDTNTKVTSHRIFPKTVIPSSIVQDIVLPGGYQRVHCDSNSFAFWLRQVPLKKDTRVFLYNGRLKANQQAQYAVLDVPVGNKDLQQCADAVMRLRAEYLYHEHRLNEISFSDNSGKQYKCPSPVNRAGFERYLEKVFAWCGTLSLEKQLHPVTDFNAIQPGNVLIKGGSPGHAVIVMDVAVNRSGKKIYLLAQSYMPAQDIHILKNFTNAPLNPWYEVKNDNSLIFTPEWTFSPNQLRRW